MAKIYIAAGHGGRDPGATADGRLEKDYTLAIANALTAILRAAGHAVTQNRTTDIDRDRPADIKAANGIPVDAYVEIHLNSNEGAPGAGVEAYYSLTGQGKTMAEKITKMIAELGYINRGAKTRQYPEQPQHDYFECIRETKMDATLVECCFINNPDDMAHFDKAAVSQKIADALLEIYPAVPAPVQAPQGPAETVYVVKKGDTLSGIAKKYGTTYQALAAYNGIANPNVIQVGQRIKILGTAPVSSSPGLAVGCRVKITGTVYATGQLIPAWVRNTTHIVSQIKDGRVLLGNPSGINSWVKISDVQVVG